MRESGSESHANMSLSLWSSSHTCQFGWMMMMIHINTIEWLCVTCSVPCKVYSAITVVHVSPQRVRGMWHETHRDTRHTGMCHTADSLNTRQDTEDYDQGLWHRESECMWYETHRDVLLTQHRNVTHSELIEYETGHRRLWSRTMTQRVRVHVPRLTVPCVDGHRNSKPGCHLSSVMVHCFN